MPILKRNGKSYKIPFEANNIAQLLYEGHEIAPDEGADELTMRIQSNLVNPILQKLRGDPQQFKTVPGQLEFQNVMPNPQNNYNTPNIDSKQVKNNYQPTGLMGSLKDRLDFALSRYRETEV